MWNKFLGITDEDVIIERDLSVLNEWYETLQAAIQSELVRYDVRDAVDLPDFCRKKVRYWTVFLKMIRKRASHIKQELALEHGLILSQKERRAQRGLKYAFYSVCSKELPQEEFERLLALARERLDKMSNNEKLEEPDKGCFEK